MRLFNSQAGQKPFVPQVVFKDGRVQLDLSPQEKEETMQKPLLVVAGNQKKVTTSRSFKKISNTEKWSEYDTRKFYRVTHFSQNCSKCLPGFRVFWNRFLNDRKAFQKQES